ncbi:MAG: hypothetical protein KatS3mg111_3492 [Pirellulaceae bacterium]|nr:MAG: hypothetical protein KatS3mg111_3492 [Pirellulaceae bacterium]
MKSPFSQNPPNDPPAVYHHGIERIVSGGQTGVDRAALDVAIRLGVPHGGWCPRGRLAEDGTIARRYRLTESESPDYAVRTQWNVRDSDGTLILYWQRLQGGTWLTYRHARQMGKPVLRVRLDRPYDVLYTATWLHHHGIDILNVAGPRASNFPQIYDLAHGFLVELFTTPCTWCEAST